MTNDARLSVSNWPEAMADDSRTLQEIAAEPMSHGRRGSRVGPLRMARVSLAMTSMIDVVFLLLIYFLAATDFRMGEEVYRLDLPDRGNVGRQRDPFSLDQEPLRISVTSSTLNPAVSRLRIDGPYKQPRSFDELQAFLRESQINDRTTGGLFEPNHPIVVVPGYGTRWEHVVEAFNCAAVARYTNITFAEPAS